MNERLIPLISGLPLFAALPDSEIAHLAGFLQPCEVPARALLFREGGSEDYCYILVEGRVEILKALGTGDERLLGVRDAVSFIGEMSVFAPEGRHTASVRALTPLSLLRMTRADFDILLQRHPRMAYDLVRVMSTRLSESETQTIHDLQEKNRQLTRAYDELRAAHEQIVEKEKLERELAVARQIQRSILPRTYPHLPSLDLGALMMPTRAVAGDFFDFIPLGENLLGVVVGDVSDKGVPAALFMSLTYSLLRAVASGPRAYAGMPAPTALPPAEALRAVNRHLLDMNDGGMFVTVLYGIVDGKTREFHYARAGHELPLVLNERAEEIALTPDEGQPLGLFDELALDEGCVRIPPGGTLFIYTDGVTDALDREQRFYGLERLRHTLRHALMANSHPSAPSAPSAMALCQTVWEDVVAYAGSGAQHDDATLLAVRAAERAAERAVNDHASGAMA